MRMTAMISLDGLYRYELRREWDLAKPPFVCIMLNPSIADARRNDPTVTRLIKRAATAGYGSLIVGNVGAGRATDPRDWAAMEDPIGPENKRALRRIMQEAKDRDGRVMIGWGTHAPTLDAVVVWNIARHIGIKLYCLGLTKQGHPRHPVRTAYSIPLRRYYPPIEDAVFTRQENKSWSE